ncbi:MAG: pentapeptide repeat-containing protein [Aureispira sp.]
MNQVLPTLCFLLGFLLVTNAYAQADDPETAYNDQQVQLLKRGYKVFNAYQAAYKKKHGSLPELNFQEAELAGMDLRGMNLDGADFRDCDLRGVRFGETPPKRTKKYDNEDVLVSGHDPVAPSSLRGANFSGSDIGEHNLKVADFSQIDGEGAIFSESDMTGAKFLKAKLHKAEFVETSLVGSNFRKADLTGADLTEADVEHASFDYTIMIRTNMAGLNVDEANMEKVIMTEKRLKEYLDKKSKSDNVYED